MNKYSYKYDKVNHVFNIMDNEEKRGITLILVGEVMAEFLKKAMSRVDAGEKNDKLAGAYQRITMMQDYLDQCVSFWRQQEEKGSKVAEYYIDAFQSAKTSWESDRRDAGAVGVMTSETDARNVRADEA